MGRVALEPFGNIVIVKLLRPNHAGESLALDVARVLVLEVALQLAVKLVGFAETLGKDGVEVGKWA